MGRTSRLSWNLQPGDVITFKLTKEHGGRITGLEHAKINPGDVAVFLGFDVWDASIDKATAKVLHAGKEKKVFLYNVKLERIDV